MAEEAPAVEKTDTGSQAPVVCPGHSRPIHGIHFSPPTADGVFFISACHDKKPMLREEGGDWVGTFEGHKGAVWEAKLNREATRAATASADYSVKLWDSISGENIHTWDHPKVVKTVDFSPDGKRLASGGNDGVLRIFDLEKLDTEPVSIPHEETSIKRILWMSDNARILTGGEDGKLRVWDATTHELQKTVELTGSVNDMEFSRDGTTLTTAAGRQVSFFDAETLELQRSHSLAFDVSTAILHPDGGAVFVAGGSEDLWVRLFRTATAEELVIHKGHHGPIHCVRFAPSGVSYSSGSDDGTIRIWPYNKATGK